MSRVSTVGAVFLSLLWLMPSAVSGDEIDEEYAARVRKLQPSDVAGHLTLAKWCRENDKWRHVARECRHILKQQPNHRQARLLLELAQVQLGKPDGQPVARPPRASGPRTARDCGDAPRPLTDDEIQVIRRAELRLDRRERVTVKIDRAALKDFVEWSAGRSDLPDDGKTFYRRNRVEQAQLMLRSDRERFADAITIRTDPGRMRDFQREVMPILLAGCATSDCHGGGGAGCFRLSGGRSLGANLVYSNYLVMHELEVGERRLVNRNSPDRSLILSYGLPPRAGDDAKPLNHPTDISAVFKNEGDADYQTVLEWLQSLDLRQPDYGIDLSKP